MLAVLIPSLVYVALIGGISLGPVNVPGARDLRGLRPSSSSAFMIVIGRENPLKAWAWASLVPVALFLMFEKWFLVPLPKGPLEAWLGY